MNKIFLSIIAILFFTSANATELNDILNKTYSKGSQLAEGYIGSLFSGPGDTEVSIGKVRTEKPTGTIMIVRPYKVEEDSVIFYQAQLNSFHVVGDTRQSLNYGVGKRFLSDNKRHFWGMNTFVDLDNEKNSRLGFGTEFKASNFNMNGNYYMDVMEGGMQVGENTERVLDGYDFNISGQIPYTPWAYITYNNYNWEAEKGTENSKGDSYSGNFNLSPHVTLELGRDENSIVNGRNFVKLIYSINEKDRPNMENGFSKTAFRNSDVREEMLTKVKRSNIITLEVQGTGVVIARAG